MKNSLINIVQVEPMLDRVARGVPREQILTVFSVLLKKLLKAKDFNLLLSAEHYANQR